MRDLLYKGLMLAGIVAAFVPWPFLVEASVRDELVLFGVITLGASAFAFGLWGFFEFPDMRGPS